MIRGTFSVNYAYHLTITSLRSNSSILHLSPLPWNRLWSLSIPKKNKHFMWKAYKDALHTINNLFKRNIDINPLKKLRYL